MIDVALLGIIRRWYIRDRISIREMARRLDISRNTVRRYIHSDTIEPSYPARRSTSAPVSIHASALRLASCRSSQIPQTKT
ncbi:HTH domain-containing protein [Herbaspirillum sp. VT-16-41]|uniref:winged helix-turn-helix transcriptional regulator n=1 Tax=Herbaspirillum sp. VT-16-41 TaxID=1953765 RepID=UPI00098136E7|nr:HTH domain-containing protein [Herbaspirillum sp. VT-16-41]